MTFNGKLLNPLHGLYKLKYGEMRNIAYPIRIGYNVM